MKKRIRLTKEEIQMIDDGKPASAVKHLKDRTKLSLRESMFIFKNYKCCGHKSTTIDINEK